jgi:hypothetical protein
MVVSNGAGSFVKETMPISNSDGKVSIKGGGLHVPGGAAGPGQPYNDCSYWQYGTTTNPSLFLWDGSELKLDHEFYMNVGYVAVLSGKATIDASDANAFQFIKGNYPSIELTGSSSDSLTLNGGPVTCTGLGISNVTDSVKCSYIVLKGGATWALGGVPVVNSTMVAAATGNPYTIVFGATGGPSTSSTGTGFGMWIYGGTDNKGGITWKLGSQLMPEPRLPNFATNGGTTGPQITTFPTISAPVLGKRTVLLLTYPSSTIRQALDHIYSALAANGKRESGWLEVLLGDDARSLSVPDVLVA